MTSDLQLRTPPSSEWGTLMLPLPHFISCNDIRLFKLDGTKTKVFGTRSHYKPVSWHFHFKGRKPLIHNVIAKITTLFIIVLMLCINLSCSLKSIKRIEATVNGVKILAVVYLSE